MSMTNNPLIGEYTKGISKGGAYFENLRRRFLREKAPMQWLSDDIETSFSVVRGHAKRLESAQKLGGNPAKTA